jgi:RNA polymerase-binding transcription factor DksA
MAAKKKAAKQVKKTTVKKATPKKSIAKKPAVKKSNSKKSAAKKPSKPVLKKATAKKTAKPVKKATAQKPAAKKQLKPVKKEKSKKAVSTVKTSKPAVKNKKQQKVQEKPINKSKNKSEANNNAAVKKTKTTEKIDKVTKAEKKTTIIEKPADNREVVKTTKNAINKLVDIPLYSKPKETVVQQPINKKVEIDTRTRYSDAELQEFKEIILKKLDEARRDLDLLKGSLTHTDDHGTDDTSPTFKMMEDGSETLSREETAQLLGRQEKFIQALEAALVRIENKTYGICRVTGKLINKERLRLVPHTTLSIEAKAQQY